MTVSTYRAEAAPQPLLRSTAASAHTSRSGCGAKSGTQLSTTQICFALMGVASFNSMWLD